MKQNIALFLGGNSAESGISEQSASQMIKYLDDTLYNVYPIALKGTSWTYNGVEIDKNNFTLNVDGRLIRFDCAVPMIHGAPGENGLLQAYLDLVKVPYTTCDVLTSALTFNKHACKTYLNSLGILFPKGKLLRKGEDINTQELLAILGLPCFIKPNSGGSSYGISKIKRSEELIPAIEAAFSQDEKETLIEEFIEGDEITCGLVKLGDEIIVFPITEIVVDAKKEFFDVEAKYQEGMADEITPARISENLKVDCETLSKVIYKYLNCRGIVRIDYIVRDNSLYFLEVNTVPGMSAASIIPKQINAYGKMSVKDVYTRLISDAISEANNKKK